MKYDEYQRGIALMVYNLLDKKSALLTEKSTSGAVKSEIMPNQELAEEKIFKKTRSILIFYRQYLGCWSCIYPINK